MAKYYHSWNRCKYVYFYDQNAPHLSPKNLHTTLHLLFIPRELNTPPCTYFCTQRRWIFAYKKMMHCHNNSNSECILKIPKDWPKTPPLSHLCQVKEGLHELGEREEITSPPFMYISSKTSQSHSSREMEREGFLSESEWLTWSVQQHADTWIKLPCSD